MYFSQVRVSSAVEAKQEELGRQLTPGEVDFVSIQVERDEIVAQFPRVEDRSEEVKKRLKSLKNKVLKKQKTLWSADKLILKKTAKTDSDRKVEQRSKQGQEAKDREREENRKRMATEENKAADRARKATDEEKAKDRARKATDEERAKARERNATEDAKAKAKERNATEEAKDKDRIRKTTEESKAKARERNATDEALAKARERMASEQNRAADKARKAKKRRELALRDQWPEAPKNGISVRSGPFKGSGYPSAVQHGDSFICPAGVPVMISTAAKCYPAPIFTWRKDGVIMGGEISGGTRNQIRKKFLASDDNSDDSSATDGSEDMHEKGMVEDLALPCARATKGLSIEALWYYCSYGPRPAKRNSSSWLTIFKAKSSDAGVYSVKMANLHGSTEKSIKISFTPTLVKDIDQRQVTVSSGMGSFRLEVLMAGGRVNWYRDGQLLTEEYREGGIGARVYIEVDSSINGYQSIKICDVEFQHAGTYVAKIKTPEGECVSSPCVVNVVQGPAPGIESEKANCLLHFEWIRHDNLCCIYCHYMCGTFASACEFCYKFYNCEGSFKADKPWPCPVLICDDCKADQTHCRLCKQELRWPDKSEEACNCAGACSHQAGQEEEEDLENIHIDEYLNILCKNKVELRNLKSADIWDLQINPKLGAKQVTRQLSFSHTLVLEHKFYTKLKVYPF